MPDGPQVTRLPWFTRLPSLRSLTVLGAGAMLLAAVAALSAWAAVVGVLAGGSTVASRWWWGETAWRRRYPQLDEDHPLVDHVATIARSFGLLRRPVVLLAEDMRSPAAAVDTAHPGSTVLVTSQMITWLAQGHIRLVQAVLAHELGHLHRFHTAVGLLQRLLGVGGAVGLAAMAGASWLERAHGIGPGADGDPAMLALGAAAAIVVAFVLDVTQNHVSELDADRDAARLGHGAELARVLEVKERRVLRRGLLTHPHSRRRVGALRKFRS